MSYDLEKRIDDLEKRVLELEDALKSKRRKETDQTLNLMALKSAFTDSKPDTRTDPFTNYELVFWYSYLARKTARPDKVDNIKELAIRANKVAVVIKYFTDYAKERKKPEPESWARLFMKDWFVYCLTVAKDKDDLPLGFYQATSDWAVTSFSAKVIEWRKIKNLRDTEA